MQKSVVERRLALSRATERSYDVFAGYAEPSGLEFCEHCNDPECAGELEATELRDLERDFVAEYREFTASMAATQQIAVQQQRKAIFLQRIGVAIISVLLVGFALYSLGVFQ